MSDKIIVYCSDGKDIDRLRMSIYSAKLYFGEAVVIYVLTDNEKFPKIYGVKTINPRPYLEELGFHSKGWNRPWPFATLYRMATPLIEEFQGLERILYMDTDVLVRSFNANWLFSMKIGDYEAFAASDCKDRQSRIEQLMANDLCTEAKTVMWEKIWTPRDTNTHAYVNAGVTLWCVSNILKNGIEWYKQRLKWFWEAECRGNFRFLDQDFLNVMMDISPTLSTRFDYFGGDYKSDCIIQHFVGGSKGNMQKTAKLLGYNF